jgi:hypothetical protein
MRQVQGKPRLGKDVHPFQDALEQDDLLVKESLLQDVHIEAPWAGVSLSRKRGRHARGLPGIHTGRDGAEGSEDIVVARHAASRDEQVVDPLGQKAPIGNLILLDGVEA